jgi:hypothetical protein
MRARADSDKIQVFFETIGRSAKGPGRVYNVDPSRLKPYFEQMTAGLNRYPAINPDEFEYQVDAFVNEWSAKN